MMARQVNRYQTRLKPIASFLDESNESGARRADLLH